MRTAIFDIETDGFLDVLTTVHSLVYYDVEEERLVSVHGEDIKEELFILQGYDLLVGHNIVSFDIPAIQKVYPWFMLRDDQVMDTLILSRLLYADIRERDFKMWRRDSTKFPGNMIGRHSLESWGYRLGEHKAKYDGGWETWSQEMQEYCEQDVITNLHMWQKFQTKMKELGDNGECIQLEHDVRRILDRQERVGFGFDRDAAVRLYSELCGRRAALLEELATAFPSWEVESTFVPKRDNKTAGYKEGVPFIKRKQVEFNPSSRDHIADRLQVLRGWKPSEFTPEGKPKVDEAVLAALPYPEARLLSQYLMIEKRIGQLAEGKQAWLKLERGGSIYGRVNTLGAVTGRMTHDSPNIAQVPSVRAEYGGDCRALFVGRAGRVLVGVDADALELRCLAGYMANFDGGDYIKTILEGRKEDGTDMHSRNAEVLKVFRKQAGVADREEAKTWFYAFIYGAGDFKLGTILGHSRNKASQAGRGSRAAILKSLPALDKIVSGVKKKARERGYLIGLDGRPLYVRGEHAALNTLLQSAGAVLMKKALVLLAHEVYELGGEFVANVHDEFQLEIGEAHAQIIGERAVDAIRRAGEHFGFKCPLDGNYVTGKNWKETH